MSSQSKHISFKAGDIIYDQGSNADQLFIIQSGEVGVFKNSEAGDLVPITIVEPNNFLGEIAMFEGRYRSSTAIALTRVLAITVDKKDFENQLKDASPWMKALFKNLVGRVQKSNEVLRTNGFIDKKMQQRLDELFKEDPNLEEKIFGKSEAKTS